MDAWIDAYVHGLVYCAKLISILNSQLESTKRSEGEAHMCTCNVHDTWHCVASILSADSVLVVTRIW
jgi:hypothetical protein